MHRGNGRVAQIFKRGEHLAPDDLICFAKEVENLALGGGDHDAIGLLIQRQVSRFAFDHRTQIIGITWRNLACTKQGPPLLKGHGMGF